MTEEIKIAEQFCLEGDVTGVGPYGNGHINETYFVVTTKRRYILQKINETVFPHPEDVVENVRKVTEHLKKAIHRAGGDETRETLTLIPTLNGGFHFREPSGCWRMYLFVVNTLCLEQPRTSQDFFESAVAFGQFQNLLADFPATELKEVLPNFHHTAKRFQAFLQAVRQDPVGRAKMVQEEIDFITQREDFYGVLENAGLPLRVTHNDTKLNNVLLDAGTGKAVCVVDLDTVMPGWLVNDFGDSIRFGANTAREDEKDLRRVRLDMDLFTVYAQGFLSKCGNLLTEQELALLPEAAKMMTMENGMRFLTDYLSGDQYFHIAFPEHNLVRCRTQLKLTFDMEQKFADMKKVVQEGKK